MIPRRAAPAGGRSCGPGAPAAAYAALALALLAAVPAGASGQSLYGQIRDGVEDGDLECAGPGHVLVARPGLELACVTPASSHRLGWPEAEFVGDDMLVNSTLEFESDGGTFLVGYEMRNGLVLEARNEMGLLLLETESAAGGWMRLEIPRAFHAWYVPEGSPHSEVVVLEDAEEIASYTRLGLGTYVVEFGLSGADPVLEVGFAYVP